MDQTLIYTLITILAIIGFLRALAAAFQIWLERKISAWMQDRRGPNRVGPFGLFQPVVDGPKFILREEMLPASVDRTLYLLAPAIALTTAMFAFAVVPFGDTILPSLRYVNEYQFVIALAIEPFGILFVFAVSSITVYAWCSAAGPQQQIQFQWRLRSSAQIVSYEIPMGMAILGIVVVSGSLNLERIIELQVNLIHGPMVDVERRAATVGGF